MTTSRATVLCFALLVAGCCEYESCPLEALIGEETASGTKESEGRTFTYVYRKYGIPMRLMPAGSWKGQQGPELAPALYDAGVPLIEISATSGVLKESDETLARKVALALCEQNEAWQRDNAEALQHDEDVFDDFYDDGVWSFVMVCI